MESLRVTTGWGWTSFQKNSQPNCGVNNKRHSATFVQSIWNWINVGLNVLIWDFWGSSKCIQWSARFVCTSWDRSGTTSWNLVITTLQGTSVATITVKTSAEEYAESSARVVLDLCGSEGGCCQTSTEGRGLDNPGEDRRKGQVDVYNTTSILGNCAEQVV